MPETPKPSQCHASSPGSADIALPVASKPGRQVRRSRMARRRAAVLILINVLMVAHFIQWWIMGTTLSPVEPSETMYLLDRGELNAGAIFFAAALLATVVFGRFFCGWGCHIVALQDFCLWLLEKVGIRPKPFRSRFLYYAPLALAVYMFVWPSAYRWWMHIDPPAWENHLLTSAFWKTFPQVGMAALTFFICGFAIVYFLGAKGFCTYGCPYGGFFAPLDKLAVGRIVVSDACEHCGHCTSVCTSNVIVHEEVARFGMVVDPGCMKCMDCVSVCPNDALSFGFTRPAFGAKPSSPGKAISLDLSFAEECVVLGLGLLLLWIYRDLYDRVPLLTAMGAAAILSFWAVKAARLAVRTNVRFQNLQLKRGGRVTRVGYAFALITTLALAFSAHSGVVQYYAWRGARLDPKHQIGDEIWLPGDTWWQNASREQRDRTSQSLAFLQRADQLGLFVQPKLLQEMVPLYLAKGENEQAERVARRRVAALPESVQSHLQLANVLRKRQAYEEAEKHLLQSVTLDGCFAPARRSLGALLEQQRRFDEALALYTQGAELDCDGNNWHLERGRLLKNLGRFAEAIEAFEALLADHPDSVQAHFEAAVCLLQPPIPDAFAAGIHLEEAIRLAPDFADGHYNLGVARFMIGRPQEAVVQVRKAISLTPDDPQYHGFLSVVLSELGDREGARQAAEQAKRLGEK